MSFKYPEDLLVTFDPSSGQDKTTLSAFVKLAQEKEWKLVTIDSCSGHPQFFTDEAQAYENVLKALEEETAKSAKAIKVMGTFMQYGFAPKQYKKVMINPTPEDKLMEAIIEAGNTPKSKNQERREQLAKLPGNRRKMRY